MPPLNCILQSSEFKIIYHFKKICVSILMCVRVFYSNFRATISRVLYFSSSSSLSYSFSFFLIAIFAIRVCCIERVCLYVCTVHAILYYHEYVCWLIWPNANYSNIIIMRRVFSYRYYTHILQCTQQDERLCFSSLLTSNFISLSISFVSFSTLL